MSNQNIINVIALQAFPYLFTKGEKPEDAGFDGSTKVYEEYGRVKRKASKLSSTKRMKIVQFVEGLENIKKKGKK